MLSRPVRSTTLFDETAPDSGDVNAEGVVPIIGRYAERTVGKQRGRIRPGRIGRWSEPLRRLSSVPESFGEYGHIFRDRLRSQQPNRATLILRLQVIIGRIVEQTGWIRIVRVKGRIVTGGLPMRSGNSVIRARLEAKNVAGRHQESSVGSITTSRDAKRQIWRCILHRHGRVRARIHAHRLLLHPFAAELTSTGELPDGNAAIASFSQRIFQIQLECRYGLASDHVNDPRHGISAINRRCSACLHFNPLNQRQRDHAKIDRVIAAEPAVW